VPLRPVVWNRSEQDFVLASPDALQHLSRWSGPEPEDWALETPHGVEHPCDSWLLIVELVSGPHNPDADQLRRAAGASLWLYPGWINWNTQVVADRGGLRPNPAAWRYLAF